MAIPEEIQEKVLAEATSATPNYEIDMNDPRFQQIDKDYANDSAELDATYGDIIGSTNKFYDDLKNANQEWADKQAQIQQENTDFAIEKIEQQKDQAKKDYIKEQSGAYVDWQKQSNKYGAEAERQAAAGLDGSGYSESSQVAMYNQYQNRVAMAKDSLDRAMLNYDNGIKEAMLQNNAAIAEIYAQNYIKQAELALEGFQYGNTLVLELANKKQQLKDNKWQKQLAMLNQINTENALKEDVRQFESTQKWNTEQAELNRLHDEKMAEINHNYQLKRDEINNAFDEKLEGIKHDYNVKYLQAKTEEDKKVAQYEYDLKVKLAEQEQKDALERIEKEYAEKAKAEKAVLDYQKSLSTPVAKTSSSSVGSSSKSYNKKVTQDEKKHEASVKKDTGYSGSNTNVNFNFNNTGIDLLSNQYKAAPNMNSVLQLGLGPISAEYLAQLVASGAVTATEKNGQIYYRKVAGKNLR